MCYLVSASHPVIALLPPYTLGLIGLQAFYFVLLQQNQKYKVANILAYLPHLNI
jgi:hypothetical protein